MTGPILLVFALVGVVMAVIEWPVLKWLGRVTWKYALLVALCINVPTVVVWSVVMAWASENVDYVAWSLLVGLPFVWGALAVIVWLSVKTLICVAMLRSWRGLVVAPLTVVWGVSAFVTLVVAGVKQSPQMKLERALKDDDVAYVQQRLKGGDAASSFMEDAANYRAAGVLKLLLDSGASANATDASGVPLLTRVVVPAQAYILHTNTVDQAVAESRALASAGTLLDHGANAALESKQGVSPFEEAINEGSLPMIELFIKKGATVSPPAPLGKAPLCNAARARREDRQKVLELLLAAGADINALETLTTRDYASSGSREVIVKSAVLNAAIRSGHEGTALWLLERGASFKAIHSGQKEPLVDAVERGLVKLTQALQSRGADVNLRTEDGRTLWQAAGNRALRKMLEARGLQRMVTALDLTEPGVDTPTWLSQVWSHNRSLGWVRTRILERVSQQPPYDVSLRMPGESGVRVVSDVETILLLRVLDSGRLHQEAAIGQPNTNGLEKYAIRFDGGILELWFAPEGKPR